MVKEKKDKLKAGLQMMGCNMFAYSMSWYVLAIMEALLTLLITTALVYALGVFQTTSVTLFMMTFFLYIVSYIPLAQVYSLFFMEPKNAALLSGVSFSLILFSWVIMRFIVLNFFPNTTLKLFCYLFSPFAFCDFMYFLSILENTPGVSLGWTTLNDLYPIWHCVLFLAVDGIIYLMLALYLDKIIPSEFGRASSPFFFLQKSFWKSFIPKKRDSIPVRTDSIDDRHGGIFELQNIDLENPTEASESQLRLIDDTANDASEDEDDEEQSENAGITISHLGKIFTKRRKLIFSDKVQVLQDLSLRIRQSQIFTLLGHNGAGKTTTVNIITGLVAPSTGRVIIDGLDIEQDLDTVRQQLGVCPQENLIFDKLTVYEHIKIFGTIKDIYSREALNEQIEKNLKQVELWEDRNKEATILSGGQKRRLNFAQAIIGDPKVIILDEPTTGLDPLSRRNIWDMLQNTKKGRTILLTTHSMEEADILGDTIAILKKGKLEVCGTSLYLKNHYGIGYNLYIIKLADCDEEQITQFIKDHIQGVEVKPFRGNELNYLLPYHSVSQFPVFLRQLDARKHELRITNYGLTQTTLEEVFLKINEDLET
jgi:ABC-type multidrug transport system ATPase subunit